MLALEPGRYFLRWVRNRSPRGDVVHRAKSCETSTGGILEFEVKAGEVVYFGHVMTHWPKSGPGDHLLIKVESHPDQARKLLRDEFGDRAEQMVARIQVRMVKTPKAIW